jgi:hypothetical protein
MADNIGARGSILLRLALDDISFFALKKEGDSDNEGYVKNNKRFLERED